jgi:hypothetical protein
MTDESQSDDPWQLAVYWYEPQGNKRERLLDCCGELLGSTHKLTFVSGEFDAILEMERLETAFEYLDYHLENYLGRVYALRDRLLTALALFTGQETDDFRHPDRRPNAAKRLEPLAPRPVQLFLELQSLLDDDIRTRNTDVHKSFFHIWLHSGNDVWEASDVLLDAQRENMYPDIERRLRELLARFVQSYRERIDRVVDLTYEFVRELESLAKPTKAQQV